MFERQDHATAVFPQFDAIRREGLLCDIRIRVGESVFRFKIGKLYATHLFYLIFSAHRVVLSATVPYFRAMFCSNMIESQQDEISIGGRMGTLKFLKFYLNILLQGSGEGAVDTLDADTMEALIQYAYTGKIQITVRNVQSLMLGAAYLSVNEIVVACGKYLQQRLQG